MGEFYRAAVEVQVLQRFGPMVGEGVSGLVRGILVMGDGQLRKATLEGGQKVVLCGYGC